MESGYSQAIGTSLATQSVPPKCLRKVVCSATSNDIAIHVSAGANNGIKYGYNEAKKNSVVIASVKTNGFPAGGPG